MEHVEPRRGEEWCHSATLACSVGETLCSDDSRVWAVAGGVASGFVEATVCVGDSRGCPAPTWPAGAEKSPLLDTSPGKWQIRFCPLEDFYDPNLHV